MNRKGILEAASKAVHAEDMDHDYGKPEDNFENIAKLWNTYMEAKDCYPELEARKIVEAAQRDLASKTKGVDE